MILPASPDAYARARDVLARGGLVALPTETVYGLAGDAVNPESVAAIYALKGRPASNPLITHITDPGQAGEFGTMTSHAQTLAGRFWPGPLTLVVDRKPSHLADGADAGFTTIALRCPDTDWRTHISGPLVMPSANRSGHVSPTTPQHVLDEFGGDLLIIDGGPCAGGLESTVVRITEAGATILRPGVITPDQITMFVPLTNAPNEGSPGLLVKHYAPAKPLRLNASRAREGEILIGFGAVTGDISLGDTLTDAAHRLYAALRTADDSKARAIAVAPIPVHGVGFALNDRLARAAKGR